MGVRIAVADVVEGDLENWSGQRSGAVAPRQKLQKLGTGPKVGALPLGPVLKK
jgi:hypothetical protein